MNAIEIIQRMRDSEINGAVSWMREGHANDLETTVHDLAENVVAGFPQSTFAKWWAEQQRR